MRYHPLSPTLQAVVFDESDLTTALMSYADRNGITLPAGQVTLRLRSGQGITELALETTHPADTPHAAPSQPTAAPTSRMSRNAPPPVVRIVTPADPSTAPPHSAFLQTHYG